MGIESEDVRYGRARLTVARSGSLLADNQLGRALGRYEEDEASAEEVAWAYVRTRTLDHSPSFVWKEARLDSLVELVAGVSDSPRVEATTPSELAAFLAEERNRERGPAAAPAPAHVASAAPAVAATESAEEPAKVTTAAPAAAPATPAKKRRLRFLPRSLGGRIALALGLLLLVGLFLGGRYYLNEVPDQLADDYRETAQPATEKITDAMDRTFAAYDEYLDNSTLPRSEIRNADEIAEIKRRFLPLYEDTQDALDFAERSIKTARSVIKKQRENFGEVPSAPLLDEKKAVTEADATVEASESYLLQAERFLRNFERFVKFDREALALRRQEVQQLGGETISPDASVEEIKASLTEELTEARQNREGYLDIDPHPDQEKLHNVYTELSTISVDYLEDLLEAYNNLSLPALRAADDEYLAAYRPLRDQASYLLGVFAADSSLQSQSRKLERQGDRLEGDVAALGTGDGELVRPDRYRGDAPKAPPKPSDGAQNQDPGQSQS